MGSECINDNKRDKKEGQVRRVKNDSGTDVLIGYKEQTGKKETTKRKNQGVGLQPDSTKNKQI